MSNHLRLDKCSKAESVIIDVIGSLMFKRSSFDKCLNARSVRAELMQFSMLSEVKLDSPLNAELDLSQGFIFNSSNSGKCLNADLVMVR